jgi:hypothetical protein
MCRSLLRDCLSTCTVPVDNGKFPLRVVIASALCGCVYCLETTVHLNRFNSSCDFVVRVGWMRVMEFCIWGAGMKKKKKN